LFVFDQRWDMETNKKLKTYACKYCKYISESIGISTIESHYYSFYINTDQWKDFYGSESIDSQKYFCINCNKKINTKIANSLIC